MNIAVCDDDALELSRITSLLDSYKKNSNHSFTYKVFNSAVELCSTLKTGEYQIIFLDILMPGINGMQAAHEIRKSDNNVKIIFLSSSPEFALESYMVKANDYILKPVPVDKFNKILDELINQDLKAPDCFYLKGQGSIIKIPYSRLIYVEVLKKRLYFHLNDKSVKEISAPLSEYEEKLLSRPEFIKAHRSFIVNLWHVEELTSNGLVTTIGETIPISRLLYNTVRNAYMEHLFVEKEVD